MAKTLSPATGLSALPAIIVPEDSIDDETALSVETPFQGLTNSDQYLLERINKVLAGTLAATGAFVGRKARGNTMFLTGVLTDYPTPTPVDVSISDFVYLYSLSHNSDIRLVDNALCPEGSEITVYNSDAAHSVTIYNPANVAYAGSLINASANRASMRFRKIIHPASGGSPTWIQVPEMVP